VLRDKQRNQLDISFLPEQFASSETLKIHAGLIGDQTNALAIQRFGIHQFVHIDARLRRCTGAIV
jgi:hypothetical protein